MSLHRGCELHSNLVSLHSETTLIRLATHPQSCELHSNLVSLHSETTWYCGLPGLRGLWITFKSCIFAFWNNERVSSNICFCSCELHSNLVSLHSETTYEVRQDYVMKLWITFKSCIFAFWNNWTMDIWIESSVVNYIQILYLCILKQLIL